MRTRTNAAPAESPTPTPTPSSTPPPSPPAAPGAHDFTTPDRISRGLFPHQVEGVAFLLKRRRAILADDMGLGKTRQAITALKVEEPAGPYLVICPASVKRNWAREIDLVLPGAAVRAARGRGR
jgi:SNF2 family DNA or RNA helicase